MVKTYSLTDMIAEAEKIAEGIPDDTVRADMETKLNDMRLIVDSLNSAKDLVDKANDILNDVTY